MKTFLAATSQQDWELAAAAMDFSAFDLLDRNIDRANYAWMLREVIDRLGTVDLESISDDAAGGPYRYPPGEASSPIVIDRDVDTGRDRDGELANARHASLSSWSQ